MSAGTSQRPFAFRAGKTLLACFAAAGLAACGGSGGGDTGAPPAGSANLAPAADAGPDRSVTGGSPITWTAPTVLSPVLAIYPLTSRRERRERDPHKRVRGGLTCYGAGGAA